MVTILCLLESSFSRRISRHISVFIQVLPDWKSYEPYVGVASITPTSFTWREVVPPTEKIGAKVPLFADKMFTASYIVAKPVEIVPAMT